MYTARVVYVLAIATAFLATPFGPGGPESAHTAAPPDGPLVLVDSWAVDPQALVDSGGQVLADYGNGLQLMRIPRSLVASARSAPGVDFMTGRTSIDLYFSGVRFDSAIGAPVFSDDLQASSPGAYLLQYVGPVRSEWVSELERQGLEFDAYIASHAFVVRGSAAAVEAAKASAYVQWVGVYHPGYRVSADLLSRSGEVRVSVIGFAKASLAALQERVAAFGRVEQAWDYPPTVIATVPAAQLARLAHDPDVLAIMEYADPVALDRIAGQIHNYHSAWDSGRSGLPTNLTGRSPGPDRSMYNSDDYTEGAGIIDTGFDEGSDTDGALDFFDSPNVDRVTRFFRHSGPTRDGECGSAHGTHVAGIIAADGYSWERYLIEDVGDPTVSVTDKEWHKSEAGVVPEGKISVDGVQNGAPPFCGTGLAVNLAYWDCQYLNGYISATLTSGVNLATCGQPWFDGAVVATHNANIDTGSRAFFAVQSNSWGDSSRIYGTTANTADTKMNSWPERIIVIAAGNDGPDANTVSGSALGKNGLTVGASQNFRPEQFDSDNPNLVADFSGRGGPGESGGRIKPDLVAIGTSVVSLMGRGEYLSTGFSPGADLITWVDKYCSVPRDYCFGGDGYADYRYLQGTSMATPHAAGLAMLVREYLREVVADNDPAHPYFNPPSYLVKAILVNGAVRMDRNLYTYPGYDQGWGRIDLEQSLFPPVPRVNQYETGQFMTSGTWTPTTTSLNVDGDDVPLKVTLVWLDAPGDAVARNIDLRVVSPGGAEYHGNQYTSGWTDPAKVGYDTINTVEQVEVEVPETGTWTVQVRGVQIPSTTRFALVFSANIGPVSTWKVDLTTTYPTQVSVSPLGSATIPVTALNYGTGTDTVQLSSTAPQGLVVSFYPSGAPVLASSESQDVLTVVTASSLVSPGIYCFDIRAVSGTDPNIPPASDFLPVCVEVLSIPLPFPHQITNGTVDELDPSVLVFEDAGTGRQIFITYRKTSQVSADGLTGGVNVWVAQATLDASGQPIFPFVHTRVSNTNDDPNDLRLLRMHAGLLTNRVVITWTGNDPAETNPDATSWSRIAYADPPYATWTVRTIQKNEGSAQPCNIARVSFPLFRAAPGIGPNGQLLYVWEVLAFTSGCTTLSAVTTQVKISTDGGFTWGPTTQVFPPPGNPNFYFFPNGVVDQNDVVWVFVYWRTPTGNDRDLTVRLLDNAGWSAFPATTPPGTYTILDTTDNVQWPAALSTTEGSSGNRVYAVFTRDNLQADLKMYMTYTDGTYSSSVIPRDYRNGATPGNCGLGCTLSADFMPPIGSGLRGPYGTAVSNANYDRRPILNIVQTTDGIVWLPHMENANPYGVPNLWTYDSSDGYATPPNLGIFTADAFAKGHQMSSTLETCVYEVYHSSRGTITAVNYEVYLLIYGGTCQGVSDTLGPLVASLAGTPNPVNRSAVFRLSANVNDITTGNSTVVAGEFFIDALGAEGTGTAMVATDASFDSPTESVHSDVDAGALGWVDNECHTVYVRGRDAAGNWGLAGSFQQCTEAGNIDRDPPTAPVIVSATPELSGPTYADVQLTWNRASDEGTFGGTTRYRVYRAIGRGGVLVNVTEIAADGSATYSWRDPFAGDGDPNTYLYRVKSVDAANNDAQSLLMAAKFARTVSNGWNLVSVPVLQTDPSLTGTFRTLSWNRARTYVAADAADPWKAYVAGKPYNDLMSVGITNALWVNVLGADSFVVVGIVPSGTQVDLVQGWNFVGFPSLKANPYRVSDLRNATAEVAFVETYDTTGPYFLRRLAGMDELLPGYGYWVYATAPAQWTVP